MVNRGGKALTRHYAAPVAFAGLAELVDALVGRKTLRFSNGLMTKDKDRAKLEQGCEREPSHLPHWLADGGERRSRGLGDEQIVEAHHGNILGDAKSLRTDGGQRAERGHVVVAE